MDDNVLNSIESIVSPNPIQDMLHISFNSALNGEYHIEIINSTGKSILEETKVLSSAYFDLDVKNLVNGAYYLNLKQGNQTKTIKFIVLK